ncbi:MAG: hypothetical protein H0U67_00390 [Gemmatimonadetes bacterium]|nr:hypothetical protein [Gemmatimonadota bacterium]MBA4159791.1 hypothetical protein [Gemmatimonadota bacterium]
MVLRTYHTNGSRSCSAALHYYSLYPHPQEVDERLSVEESWTPERVRRELPFASLAPVLGGEGA